MTARRTAVAFLAVALGCAHEGAFLTPDHGAERPLYDSQPTRLTYNQGTDLSPSWLPDGSGILYTVERLDRPDRDWCIAQLPPGGGRAVRTFCNTLPAADESTNTFLSAALGPGDRLVYQRSTGRRGELGGTAERARARQLVLATLGAPLDVAVVTGIPYTIAGQPLHGGVSQVRWLDGGSLVYRGDFYSLVCFINIPFCPQVLVRSGLGLVRATLGDPPVLELLPGTEEASSVAVGASPDEIVYTLNGDSRVFRVVLSSGVSTVLFDFGTIVRDVQVNGDRLVAVVGGSVSYTYSFTAQRSLQVDGGGDLCVVDLPAGSITVLSGQGRAYRNPALSPDGRRLVAEAWEAGVADLYLFELP